MILYLPGMIFGISLILAASRELQSKDAHQLTALLSLGLTEIAPLWRAVEELVSRLSLFDQSAFDRRNPLHRVAGLLLIAVMTLSIWQGVTLPDDAAKTFFAPDIGGIILSMAVMVLIYVSLSALGAGWGHRRDPSEVLQRLGLKRPALRDCVAGLVFGFLLYVGATIATSLVMSVLPADQFGAQMDGSRQLFDVVKDSLPVALLVALLAGTGEEILFRGALQPVFGLFVSSLFFTLVHLQYGLSPATLILFFVSLGMGLVRARYNTTASIIAHATYNFVPFMLYRLAQA